MHRVVLGWKLIDPIIFAVNIGSRIDLQFVCLFEIVLTIFAPLYDYSWKIWWNNFIWVVIVIFFIKLFRIYILFIGYPYLQILMRFYFATSLMSLVYHLFIHVLQLVLRNLDGKGTTLVLIWNRISFFVDFIYCSHFWTQKTIHSDITHWRFTIK